MLYKYLYIDVDRIERAGENTDTKVRQDAEIGNGDFTVAQQRTTESTSSNGIDNRSSTPITGQSFSTSTTSSTV